MLALYLCYFTFGFAMTFGSIAMNFEMMDSLKFTPVEMTMSYGVIAIPWCIKPLFGIISDKYLVADWGKRRPYIFCSGILLAYMYVTLPNLIGTKTSMIATMTMVSFFMCFADVCADCITVDFAKKESVKGKTQSTCWSSRALGSVIGSSLGGSFYKMYGYKPTFQLIAVPCLIMGCCIWTLAKNETGAPNNMCKKLVKAVYKKRVLAFAIFGISIGPNYGPLYTYFLRKELNYTPEDFQWITIAGSYSFLASTFIYKTCLLNVSPLKLMRVSIYCAVACSLVQLLVVTKISTSLVLIVFDTIGQSLFGMWIMMPLIVIVAHNAEEGLEGTFYALLMSVSNLSAVIADELGGLVANMFGVTRDNFDNMACVIVVGAVADLVIPLFIVNSKSFAAFFEEKPKRDPKRDQKDRNPDSQVQMGQIHCP